MLREVFLAFFYIIFTWRKRCTLTLFLEMDFVLGRAEEKRDQRRWKKQETEWSQEKGKEQGERKRRERKDGNMG